MVGLDNYIMFSEFCYHRHDVYCNQKYDETGMNVPYSFHLKAVVKQVEKYKSLLPSNEYFYISMCAAAGHDLIEDARMTYNDVLKQSRKEIADIIYACTELRGHDRGERHGEDYMKTLSENKLAVFVKLCDIIANVKYGLLTNSSMLKSYRKEFPKIKEKLYISEYYLLFEDIEDLLSK